MKRTIRVLCVDDHDFLHDGLRSRFALEPDIECVGHAASADELLAQIDAARPDVVLLDIEMPGSDPFAAIGEVRRRAPGTRVIMLSAFVRDHYIDSAIDNGAWGYFSKGDPPQDVIEGIRRVAGGETAFGRDVRERMQQPAASESAPPGGAATRLQLLTSREREILRMIGKGMARADIARQVHRSFKTIDAHHTSIMKKLDIHDRAELALFAVREGLVEQ